VDTLWATIFFNTVDGSEMKPPNHPTCIKTL